MGIIVWLDALYPAVGIGSICLLFISQVKSAPQRDRQLYQTNSVGSFEYHAPY